MYEPIKAILAKARTPGLSRVDAFGYLQDAAVEAASIRVGEYYGVKLALVLSCAQDLMKAGIITKADLCDLADEMTECNLRYGKVLALRLAASLRRMVLCP